LLAEREDLSLLMSAVARQDRAAFKRVYEQTSARLFGCVLKIVRDRALAEEVLQEAYLRIWEKASSYRADVGSPLTWMTSIARNRAIDVIRKRKEVLAAPSEEGEDWLERVEAVRSGDLDFEDREGLRRCLERLEETQRNCIVLAYCGGYSRDELAMRYERPVSTIKTWLHRGLAALRTCLETP
jgi:RNA polymerase sigma factor (sigma-70 family)